MCSLYTLQTFYDWGVGSRVACLVGNGAMVGGGARLWGHLTPRVYHKKTRGAARRAIDRGVAADGVAAGELRARVT